VMTTRCQKTATMKDSVRINLTPCMKLEYSSNGFLNLPWSHARDKNDILLNWMSRQEDDVGLT